MIDIHAPITVNQFDEKCYAIMERALEIILADVQAMRAQLQAVLDKRQADIDALTAQLKLQNDSLALAVSNAQLGTTASLALAVSNAQLGTTADKQPKEK